MVIAKGMEAAPSDRTKPQPSPSRRSDRMRLIREGQQNIKVMLDMIYLIEDVSVLVMINREINRLLQFVTSKLREQRGLSKVGSPLKTKVNPPSKRKCGKPRQPSKTLIFNKLMYGRYSKTGKRKYQVRRVISLPGRHRGA